MKKQPTPIEHRVVHQETTWATMKKISEFSYGDVFVREGSPCMIGRGSEYPSEGKQLIINLQTGGVWEVSIDDLVYTATNVKLSYQTGRHL